jgi:tetratricopeptide (TPR) repeat protein
VKRLLIPLVLLLGAPGAAATYESCLAEAKSAPDKAVATATAWRLAGGGVAARHCLGVAYVAGGKFALGALAFEQAARAAEAAKTTASGDLWGQAGNAALLGGDAEKATEYFNAALAASAGDARRQGEVLIDRARAAVDLGKLVEAKDDLDKAVKLAPTAPDGWLLRATLARKDGRYDDAQRDVDRALQLVPADPAALLEAGNIAGLLGDTDTAKARWEAAVKADPKSDAGKAAAKALAANVL